jgi:hypothetical protein
VKLEFLPSGSSDCPLIRLYGFTAGDASELRTVFSRLANGSVAAIKSDALPFLEPLGGISLAFKLGPIDQGIVSDGQSVSFEWIITSGSWSRAAELAEAFCQHAEPSCFQWLDESSGIKMLLSVTGEW